jgi:hypothetical protein
MNDAIPTHGFLNSEGIHSTLKFPERPMTLMTLDDKIRIGMVALTGGSIALAALGVHVNPLSAVSGAGPG